jgi:transposase-like protein
VVDQDGDVIDILVQPRRDQRATERFFRRLMKGQGDVPRRMVTDKLRISASGRDCVWLPTTMLSSLKDLLLSILESGHPNRTLPTELVLPLLVR